MASTGVRRKCRLRIAARISVLLPLFLGRVAAAAGPSFALIDASYTKYGCIIKLYKIRLYYRNTLSG